jgi:hypothetical protein
MEQKTIIRWEQPTPRKGGQEHGSSPGSQWDTVAEQLRANRGRWAVVAEGDMERVTALAAIATRIRRAGLNCFAPAGDFEAAVRRADGRATVYARYLGDDAE